MSLKQFVLNRHPNLFQGLLEFEFQVCWMLKPVQMTLKKIPYDAFCFYNY
jgi:hypothetical protein